MAKITWSKAFSVGVAELDAQHQKIIELINMLEDPPGEHGDSGAVGYVLNEMHSYIITHFGTEEAMLKKKKYPGLMEQKASHDAFIKEFSHICQQVEQDRGSGVQHLMAYLSDWWTRHILEDDMKYKSYF